MVLVPIVLFLCILLGMYYMRRLAIVQAIQTRQILMEMKNMNLIAGQIHLTIPIWGSDLKQAVLDMGERIKNMDTSLLANKDSMERFAKNFSLAFNEEAQERIKYIYEVLYNRENLKVMQKNRSEFAHAGSGIYSGEGSY